MLTPKEREVLEKWRNNEMRISEAAVLCDAMLRLFPVRKYGETVIRWDDPVTPERLVACGWVNRHGDMSMLRCGTGEARVDCWIEPRHWNCHFNNDRGSHAELIGPYAPRNMLDVWNLMEQIGGSDG
jgi:hypothetical protein